MTGPGFHPDVIAVGIYKGEIALFNIETRVKFLMGLNVSAPDQVFPLGTPDQEKWNKFVSNYKKDPKGFVWTEGNIPLYSA
jgi:hypothetical protein